MYIMATASPMSEMFDNVGNKEVLKASIAAYKGHKTCAKKEGVRLMNALATHPTSIQVQALQDVCNRLQHYSAMLEASYGRLQIIDAAYFIIYQAKKEETSNECAEQDRASRPATISVSQAPAPGRD